MRILTVAAAALFVAVALPAHAAGTDPAVRAVLSRAIAQQPSYFASLIDHRHAATRGDGYLVYAATPSLRALCPTCKIEIYRTKSGSTATWSFNLSLPDVTTDVRPTLDALRALVAPLIPSYFHFTGRQLECDGGSQSYHWSGPRGAAIEVDAGNDPGRGASLVSRSIIISS
jgi:hypothetical protein